MKTVRGLQMRRETIFSTQDIYINNNSVEVVLCT